MSKSPERAERVPYEHPFCKGCQWNDYPNCKGTILSNSRFASINHLSKNFKCGQKDKTEVKSFKPTKSRYKLIMEKITQLEDRIKVLEDK